MLVRDLSVSALLRESLPSMEKFARWHVLVRDLSIAGPGGDLDLVLSMDVLPRWLLSMRDSLDMAPEGDSIHVLSVVVSLIIWSTFLES